ncbi:hypothetical protein AB838_05750 [Rhodobacteraceae bacterium (ex Bugula neritina AB1)]|nr:hypothetical protein AB838_05750 [Rhodobacteraceae bacterium (ex Bugula neritina AB1)]
MKVFMAIVEAGSFTKGAIAEKISQPAAAAIVDEIEDVSRHQLFLRSGKVRTTKPTPVGEEVLKVFSRVVSSYELEIGKITNLHRSVRKSALVQDAYSSNIDMGNLTEIMSRYQETNIEISSHRRQEVIDAVAKREAIIGFIDDTPDSSNVDFKQIGQISICLAVPVESDFLGSSRELLWSNVPEGTAVFSGISPKLLSQVQANLSAAGLDASDLITINNKEFTSSFLSELKRPVIVPSTMTEEIEASGIARVLNFSHSPVSAPLGIITPKGYMNAMRVSNRDIQGLLKTEQTAAQAAALPWYCYR